LVATVRRRRRTRRLAAGVLAAALVLAPAAGYALIHDRPGPGPQTGTSATPGPSQSESAPTGPTASATSSAAPDPGIPAVDILNGTLTLPPWPAGLPGSDACTSGPVRFTGGKSTATYGVTIVGQPAHVDVDHDGSPESLVLVRCVPQAAVFQVLVYDRAPGGPIRLLGRVLATPAGAGREGVDVLFVHAVEPTADGHIRVDVGDYAPAVRCPPTCRSTSGAPTAGPARASSRRAARPRSAPTRSSPTCR
jgi:hypothetical protein